MLIPHAIRRQDDGLVITWAEGDAGRHVDARTLRLACPCAACHDEMTGAPLLDADRVPQDIRPISVALVGTYGVKVSWSDGHDTGIYTFALLRRVTQAGPDPEEAGDG